MRWQRLSSPHGQVDRSRWGATSLLASQNRVSTCATCALGVDLKQLIAEKATAWGLGRFIASSGSGCTQQRVDQSLAHMHCSSQPTWYSCIFVSATTLSHHHTSMHPQIGRPCAQQKRLITPLSTHRRWHARRLGRPDGHTKPGAHQSSYYPHGAA